ncbi:nucleolar protein 16-like [Limulus polyphemus]|uniref:Nucleolar protein 16 n=1 Tax=Limulus polyphemus TaxID=6850 RepID=A0ABM1BNS9_LIMPO|nr:nucleolar protein 16-like [Limulus polyphemus]
MGKARGTARRKSKKYNYSVNKKKKHRKMINSKGLKISCQPIREAWNSKKSVYKNLEEMGLSVDPNDTMQVTVKQGKMSPEENIGKKKMTKGHVVKDLEKEATAPRAKGLRLPKDVVVFCTYMLEKYGDDYKAMARDPRNYYQETPKTIFRRIQRFKNISPQWNGYLRAKELKTNE